ncbi:hypothetical protein RvY_04941-2 [Ramazzottius varieornatus]|uniref:Uncharacterized protein n=1 Tax=Ramazzottius varieornatus TaxID=947166 RepID=A0A1D1V009_RAMVA|nr:hypothetical protein RvY_04941-2 [Ramazzottius varieornatus]
MAIDGRDDLHSQYLKPPLHIYRSLLGYLETSLLSQVQLPQICLSNDRCCLVRGLSHFRGTHLRVRTIERGRTPVQSIGQYFILGTLQLGRVLLPAADDYANPVLEDLLGGLETQQINAGRTGALCFTGAAIARI